MKVTTKILSDKAFEDRDYRQSLIIEIDGKKVFDVSDGEPEDSNLLRDFSDCYNIVSLMKQAYYAGKRGETFEEEDVETNE